VSSAWVEYRQEREIARAGARVRLRSVDRLLASDLYNLRLTLGTGADFLAEWQESGRPGVPRSTALSAFVAEIWPHRLARGFRDYAAEDDGGQYPPGVGAGG